MTNLSWKERFEHRANGRVIDRVPSGSPAILALRFDPKFRRVNSITAMQSLVRRHLPLLKAKRGVEAAMEHERAYLHVPCVEDVAVLEAELREAGFGAKVALVNGAAIDVKALRERLAVSQEQFAARYRISLDVLQNWEQKRNEPDPIARNVLEMIARDPVGAETALWGG